MRALVTIITILTLAAVSGFAASYSSQNYDNLPKGVYTQLKELGFFDVYDIYFQNNPFMQRGDFNADGRVDIALQVISKLSGKRGILIMHQGERYTHILGAGKEWGIWGDDFDWLTVWKVDSYTMKKSRYNADVEALILNHPSHPKSLVYWNGEKYDFHEMEDYYYYQDSAHILQPLPGPEISYNENSR